MTCAYSHTPPMQHADMSEREVDSTVQRFKAACRDPSSINPDGSLRSREDSEPPPVPDSGSASLLPTQQRQQQQQQQRQGRQASGSGSGEADQRPLIEVGSARIDRVVGVWMGHVAGRGYGGAGLLASSHAAFACRGWPAARCSIRPPAALQVIVALGMQPALAILFN
jgi:hypothetical protein